MAGVIRGTEYSPGTYNIEHIKVAGEDVKWLMMELNIYEDLFAPCMTGDLTLVDTHNLLSNTPFLEGDLVEVHLKCNADDKLQTSVDGKEIKAEFEIIKIQNRSKTKDNQQVYTLKFSSTGWSNNVRTRISRAYNQKKYSDIVKDIFDSKFKKPFSGLKQNIKEKKLKIEPTEGDFNVIIPRWKPITCFNWLAARSRKGKACNYLFWEDKDEFHFESIESLMKNGPVDEYSVPVKNTLDPNENVYLSVSDYQYMDTGEVLYYALNGMFGNRMVIHDICNKKIHDHFLYGREADNMILEDEFVYQDMFDETTHVDGGGQALVEKEVTEKFSDSPGNARLTVLTRHYKQFDEVKDFEYDKWLRERISQKDALKYLKIKVWATGMFKRKVGDKLTFNMPSPEANNTSEKNDPRLQGNYLVTAIRHKFDVDKHVLCMELVKDNIYGG